MKTFQEYLEIAHIGKGFLSERVHKTIMPYLKGDNVGGYLGHSARFAQLDLIIESIFLNGPKHLTPKQLGEFLISVSGRHIMDSLEDHLEQTAKTFFAERREEIIEAAKKAAETTGDEDI